MTLFWNARNAVARHLLCCEEDEDALPQEFWDRAHGPGRRAFRRALIRAHQRNTSSGHRCRGYDSKYTPPLVRLGGPGGARPLRDHAVPPLPFKHRRRRWRRR